MEREKYEEFRRKKRETGWFKPRCEPAPAFVFACVFVSHVLSSVIKNCYLVCLIGCVDKNCQITFFLN